MKKVPQEAGERLARDRWQFFERLFGALRLSGQRVMERSLQGAVEGQAEAVRGADGEVLLRACPGCGSTLHSIGSSLASYGSLRTSGC